MQGLFITLFWIGLLGFVVSLVMVGVSLFKKTGKAKKWAWFLVGSVVVFFVSVAGIEPNEKTSSVNQVKNGYEQGNDVTSVSEQEYEVIEENLKDNGTLYLTVSSHATSENDLLALANEIKEEYHNKKIDSCFLYIRLPGEENNDGDDIFNPAIFSAKFAFTKKGLTQTGIKKIGEIEYEYLSKNLP